MRRFNRVQWRPLCGLLFCWGLLLVWLSGSAAGAPVEQNHAVKDVKSSFDDLTHRGEWLGFRRSLAEAPANHSFKAPGYERTELHFQGFARSPRTGVAPTLYATRSGCPDDCPEPWKSEGTLLVVQMNSRTKDGERLRSNRLLKGTGAETQHTLPPEEDKVVKVIAFDQNGPRDDGSTDYSHPGGIQMVGDILAVPLSHPNNPDMPHEGKVVFFDASDPTDPEILDYELVTFLCMEWDEQQECKKWADSASAVGAVGVTKLPDGHFFLVVATGGAEELVFFRSNKTSFFDDSEDEPFAFEYHSQINKKRLEELKDTGPGYWDFGMNSPQSLNFVNQSDGKLFLIGSSNTCETAPLLCGGRRDRMWLWQVTGFNAEGNAALEGKSKENKYLFSEGNLGGDITFDKQEANFSAAASAYVSPTGQLLYYGTSYFFWTCKKPAGPDGRRCDGGRGHTKCDPNATWTDCTDPSYNYLRFAELHHNTVSDTGTCGLQPFSLGGPYEVAEGDTLLLNVGIQYVEPWIRMYEEDDWQERCWEGDLDPNDSYRCSSHTMDWADQNLESYDEFDYLDGPDSILHTTDGFNNQLTSFRWCGPPDSKLYLCADNYCNPNEDYETYYGDGRVFEERDLDGSGFNNRASSAEIEWAQPEDHEVDVDWGDAATEQWAAPWADIAIPASHVYLDDDPSGTASDVYTITVTDAQGGVAQTATSVTVLNVAPAPSIDRLADESGAEIGADVPFALAGFTVHVFGSFTDPGSLDTHIASVDWGDGTISDLGGVAETLSASHAYAAPSDYTIAVRVEDDDGGVGTATRALAVVDTSRALAWIVDELRPLAADRNVRRALGRLEGEAGGRAANGAIDMLAKRNLNAARVKIEQAIKYVEAADAANPGLDLGTIERLLAQSAESLAARGKRAKKGRH